MPKTIAILNATGNQGSGLIRALLAPNFQNNDYKVRALTRNTTSPAAEELQSTYGPSRLELVKADIYDADSLRKAFKDVDGVFAATNNRLPGKKIETEDETRHELVAGWNIIDAARDCDVSHMVLSSLPNLNKASNGRFSKVFHFDHKNTIEEYAKKELRAVTVLWPGFYYSNVAWPQYCRKLDNGTIRFCAPASGDVRADWVDAAHDIGVYAAAIFTKGPTTTGNKTYPVVSPKIRFSDFARIFESKTGKKAMFDPISLDEWGSTVAAAAGKGYEEDIRQMMEWVGVAPGEKVCYGTMESGEDRSWEELGVRASTFEEWLERSGWRGPG
ncbi:NmrA/HSCARG family protein [Aspergillus glaucus CBS 516.65]|uniref:NmrA-like domain-containing protein n=1 Tax=Aspergillus glaucus CBS 516.65 TaxID=1160497 RepID=A0A1L9VZR1_ASPGL|nr:hypothetical protein ASPGLDRAFT_236731 [Aspergillus glaucus CBS 516.65]OJJ89413.1 hypothetical protein ASPGLDRAFT_236731 [Aspergillus glaucus CBS 516.65]